MITVVKLLLVKISHMKPIISIRHDFILKWERHNSVHGVRLLHASDSVYLHYSNWSIIIKCAIWRCPCIWNVNVWSMRMHSAVKQAIRWPAILKLDTQISCKVWGVHLWHNVNYTAMKCKSVRFKSKYRQIQRLIRFELGIEYGIKSVWLEASNFLKLIQYIYFDKNLRFLRITKNILKWFKIYNFSSIYF